MKRFQFSTRHILLATAFIAVICGTSAWYGHILREWYTPGPVQWRVFGARTVVTVPLWIPVVFVGYAIGRRSFTAQSVVIFAIIQLFAIVLTWRVFYVCYAYLPLLVLV